MFQFRRFPSYSYFIQSMMRGYCPRGFPHSDIPGSLLICSSPRLFAACRVLRRLLMPRHSPCALFSLTMLFKLFSLYFESCRFQQNLFFAKLFFTLNNFKVFHFRFCLSVFNGLPSPTALCCLAFFLLFSVQFSRCKKGAFASASDRCTGLWWRIAGSNR